MRLTLFRGITRDARHADVGLLLVAAIWGMTFPAIRAAMTAGASPLAFVGIRFGLAALLMLPLAARSLRRTWRPLAGPSVMLGLLLGSSYTAQTVGMTSTTAARSGLITGLSVVIVPLLDGLVHRRAPRVWVILGGVVATCGLCILSGVHDVATLGTAQIGDL